MTQHCLGTGQHTPPSVLGAQGEFQVPAEHLGSRLLSERTTQGLLHPSTEPEDKRKGKANTKLQLSK